MTRSLSDCLQFTNLTSSSNQPLLTSSVACGDVKLSDDFTLAGSAANLIDTPGFDYASKPEGVSKMITAFLAIM